LGKNTLWIRIKNVIYSKDFNIHIRFAGIVLVYYSRICQKSFHLSIFLVTKSETIELNLLLRCDEPELFSLAL